MLSFHHRIMRKQKRKEMERVLSQSWEIAQSKDSMSKVCISKLFMPNCF